MIESSPISTGKPVGASTTQFSRTVVLAPILTASSSPLTTAPIQTLEPSPIVTSPMIQLPGARNADSWTFGSFPSKTTFDNRVSQP
jgi:hypothetical protein